VAKLILCDGSELPVFPGENRTSFTLEEVHNLVGGYVEFIELANGDFMLIDEDGGMKKLPRNDHATFLARANTIDRWISNSGIVGNALVGTAEEFGFSQDQDDIKVVLHFESKKDRNDFMGGLVDGWGEDHCNVQWDWEDGMKFDEAIDFNVTVNDDRNWED
jgi:hypothetical protein